LLDDVTDKEDVTMVVDETKIDPRFMSSKVSKLSMTKVEKLTLS